MRIATSPARAFTPTAIALGNFDGVHRGHRHVIDPIVARARRQENLHATVVTFDPHPREFFSGETRQLLTPTEEKSDRLAAIGIEQLVLLPFDRDLAALSPREFVAEILIAKLQAKEISVGADFRFGKERTGTAEELETLAAQFGIRTHIATLKTASDRRISSSRIRQALETGDLTLANQLLGYSYCLTGRVIYGRQLGRTIGFPTANLEIPSIKFLPREGVYSVRVASTTSGELPANCAGVVNIGTRPTVDGTSPSIEVHLLDWSGDLYGHELSLYLKHFIRPEQKFPSIDALKTQIAADCETARRYAFSSA